MVRWTLALLLLPVVGRAAEAPILCLDPGGHTATVKQVLFTPDGREVISVGDDKAIRIWELATGRITRTLRGRIGPGPEGMLYAAALTPDGRTLAVGGYAVGAGRDGEPIHLWDLATGRITQALRGHTKVIAALAVSRDGRRLASAAYDGTIRVWRLDAAAAPPLVLQGHEQAVLGVAWSPDGQRLASAGLDRTARIWRVPAAGAATCERTITGHAEIVRCVDWSPDGALLATGSFDQTVRLWDPASGAPLRTLPKQVNQLCCLAFSPDGRRLVAGQGGLPGTYPVPVWAVPEGRQERAFNGHGNTVRAVAWSRDGRLVASADALGDLEVWEAASGQTVRSLRGTGANAWALAWSPDGARVAWGHTNRSSGVISDSPLERSFDLLELTPAADVGAGERWVRAVAQQGGRRLAVSNDLLSVRVLEGDREVTGWRHRTESNSDSVRCFSFTPAGQIVVGSNYSLRLWSPAGQLRREFVGHTGNLWDLAVSTDGRYLASTAGDQTIRFWSLGGDAAKVEPLLSLFVGTDREWVAWTPAGYYACSANADRIIGWQVNRGADEAAEYFPAYQFRRQLHRPDVISRLLETGDLAKAVELADATRRTKTDAAVTAATLASFAPPSVSILAPREGAVVSEPRVEVRARIRDPNNLAIQAVQVLLNGRNESTRAIRPKLTGPDWTQTITLVPGENQITLLAVNAKGAESLPGQLTVTYRPPQRAHPPTLYALAIGISQYQAAEDSLRFAAKDARDYAAALLAQRGRLYGDVRTTVLVDAQATRGNLLDALEALAKEATARDHVHVFIAGHGVQDTSGSYWLLPHDGDPDRLARTAIRWTELQTLLQAVAGRVFVALDTCHSAGAGGTRGMRTQVYNDALRQIGQTEVGLITAASCQAGELSLEREDWGNGAFTKALLAGLQGEADTNADGEIILAELEAFVLGRVKQLTEGRQHPTFLVPPTFDRSLVVAATR